MENNERDRKLDQWLDDALSQYSAAEPRFGLEARVLKRVRAEEQRSRKWILWRWMPAFAAIAAIVVVAVAVRPMLEKKPFLQNAPVRRQEAMDSYLVPGEQKGAAANGLAKSKSAPPAHSDQAVAQLDRKHKAEQGAEAPIQPRTTDRDAISTTAAQAGLLDSRQSVAKKLPVGANESVTIYNAPAAPAAAVAPLSPPPPAQGMTNKEAVASAGAAPAGANVEKSQPTAQADEHRAPSGVLSVETLTAKSLADLEPKERRQMRAAKTQADREDANVIDAFGVKVRFQTGPQTQQFPTPAPLSKQEKLALAAGRQLKDSAVTEQKPVDIAPIEIKELEIKPLGGPEKQK